MPVSKQFMVSVGATVVGVFVAGFVMNAARDVGPVHSAISGYDA